MCLGHQCSHEEERMAWGRTHEEDYLTETSPQVWSLSGFASREAGSNGAAMTTAPFPPNQGNGHSGVGSCVVSPAMQCLCTPEGICTVTFPFWLPEAGSPQGGSICHYRDPSDFKARSWQMPSPPLPMWWHLQKRPGRPSLVKRSLGRDLWWVRWGLGVAVVHLSLFWSFLTGGIKGKQL